VWAAGLEQKDAWRRDASAANRPETTSTCHRSNNSMSKEESWSGGAPEYF